MNRTEALQAAFMIAGPNVTAEEHIQYAEFLLGDQNEIILEGRISKTETNAFLGQPVREMFDDAYPGETVALDEDRDVYQKTSTGWTRTLFDGTYTTTSGPDVAEYYNAVIVA